MILDRYLDCLAATRVAPPHKTVLHLDFETYSEVDLRDAGASRYARDPSTEVLMLAYGWAEGEIKQWVPAAAEPMPDDLREALHDPYVTLAAWNAPFEWNVMTHTLGIHVPVYRWLDVMALAFSLALPGKLETCGKVIGLPEDKQKDARGKALIRRFCQPRKPTKHMPWTRDTAKTRPEEWQEFLDYNIRDVEAERQIYHRLKRYQMPDHEWRLWHLDQKINNAGIPINIDAVNNAIRIAEDTMAKDMAEMRELTGLQNPNSNQQLLPWLREAGYQFLDLKKGHIERALEDEKNLAEEGVADMLGHHPDLVRVLELRLRVSKASVKKFWALAKATDDDGALRGCHQFAGAGRTWRWSGRRFQPQNLSKPSKGFEKWLLDKAPKYDLGTGEKLGGLERAKAAFGMLARDVENLPVAEFQKKYPDTMEALVAAVRPMQAKAGEVLADADLSAIENVVLGWLARDDKILRVFRQGLDPYIDFATDMFGMTYDEIAAEVESGDKSKRTTAKPGVLGCGYMLGKGEPKENKQTGEIEATGLLGYSWNMGVMLTPEMSALSVETFRSKFKRVKAFWYEMEGAVKRVIRHGKPERVGYLYIDMKGPFMRIRLPSGRHLHYMRPKLVKRKMPWGKIKTQVTYQQMEMGQWRRVSTHPGKLVENVVQAVARDLLAHGMMLADEAGIDTRLHVHDQIVATAPEGRAEKVKDLLIDLMTRLPDWADDKLPLKAAGHTTPIFVKD